MATSPAATVDAGVTPVRGLTQAEAVSRLATEGPNTLPTPPRVPAWRLLLAEMFHFFALLFWVAGTLAFVAGMPQLGVAVFVVVVLNGLFAFVQEERAEHAAERLQDLLPRRVTVVRDGTAVQVPAAAVVTGDAVLIEQGDRVSADLRLDVVHALSLDTSTLTGESVPAHPSAGDLAHAGCFVVEGEARATVVATGPHTRLAGIAGLTRAQRRAPSPLHLELSRVSRIIAAVAIAVGTGFFGLAVIVGMPPSDGFLFAVGVTVAVVPCGLLPTVTLSLAIGAQRMAGRHALVRHLEAVETLGSTTFICTDKTGTLTRNEMAVVEVWMPGGRAVIEGIGYDPAADVLVDPAESADALRELARAALRCSSGRVVEEDGAWVARGDPMEAALDALARRVGVDEASDTRDAPEVVRFPFDARRRRMSVVVGDRIVVKGAPDAIFPRCTVPEGAIEALQALAGRGLRVLAVAARERGGEPPPRLADAAERGLTLLGLVALEDPPRHGAAAAIAACRRAGIRVAMVTGDHPATARAIAHEVGLLDGDDELVVVGRTLPADDGVLGALLDRDGAVVARVSPEDKLRIARALRHRGHVVAMTGDGVNDAPALSEAAIGVAMGRTGTDVAREAADLVLLDDDFATIVAAIEQGRSTFSNIRRFLTYHLTDNVAELTPFVVWALSGGRFPLAIGVLQILALDIGTDILPALALGAEPPATDVLDRPPIRHHLLDRRLFTRAFGVLGPVEAAVSLAAFLAVFITSGWRPGDTFPHGATLLAASGAAFTAVVLGQAANAFACRSTLRPAWQLGWTTNRLLLGAVAAELGMLAGFLYLPPLADLLDQAPPSLAGFAVALVAIPAVLVADALHKAARSATTWPVAPASTGRPAGPYTRDPWPHGGPPPASDDRGAQAAGTEEEPSSTPRAHEAFRGPSTLVPQRPASDAGGVEGQRILVGVDGSEIAREALRWAMGLAERLDAEVVAAHAVGLLEDIHGDVPAGARRAELRDLVEQTWCAPLARARCPHRVELRDGPAADVLLDVAATEHAGLLVVGSRGVGAAQPALALGSTSLRVLQIARLPVLVVPERRERAPTGEVPELRHIVVGVDRSEPSLAALDLAADVAQLLGGSLSVLEVIEYVPPFPLGPSTTVTSAGEEDAPRRAMALLESAAQSIRERGVAVQVIVRSGDPAATLLEVADDVDADLVVVGTRGRGGPSEPMLGSVARTVAGRVRRPTLVLPGAAGAVRWGPPEELPDAQPTGTDS